MSGRGRGGARACVRRSRERNPANATGGAPPPVRRGYTAASGFSGRTSRTCRSTGRSETSAGRRRRITR